MYTRHKCKAKAWVIWSCLKTCKKLTQFCAAQFVEIILKVAFVSTLIPHIKVVSTITRFPPTKVRCYGHINTAPFMWILFNGIFSRGQSGYDAGLGIHCLVYNVSLESRRNRDTFSFSIFFSIPWYRCNKIWIQISRQN